MFRFSRISRCTRTNRKYFYRQRCLVLVAGQNGQLVDAASPVVSRDKVNSSCNHFWRKRWPREPLQVPRATRTRSFDPYWSISSTVRRCSDSPKNVGVKYVCDSPRPHRALERRRQVESARRASASCRRAPSDSRRGWGRKHQFVAFPSTSTSRGLSSSTPQRIALHCTYTARLWCAFTTQSMAVAYASSRQPKPKVRLVAPSYVDLVISINRCSLQARVLRNTAHDFSKENGRPPFFITTLPC